ncbi:carboxylesterase family protein [Amycolatopsis sp. NPDC051903]|uniref:carboxylesterase family protein n=1 Tax=Amycolatopsis sp. NPDC051903 TaxID=3363936 RepID=UPI0037A48BF7
MILTGDETCGRRWALAAVGLHGGDGTGAGADYDPARMVEQGDVNVVTVNYRLGAFGNFALPQLGSSADFGTQDQLAALWWVKQNAAAFGGDPGNVTVFGESSGAFATCALLSSPDAVGLVQRAIIDSSSCSAYFPKNTVAPGLGRHTLFTPLAQAQAAGTAVGGKFGCATGADVLACLRRVPAKAWLDGGYTEVFTATPYGTPVLPAPSEMAMRERRIAGVPVLFGTNRDELRLDVAAAAATAAQQDLSRTMIGHWTRFARTGDPNGPGLPAWPKYADGARVQRFAPGKPGPVDAETTFKCALWRSVGQ